MRRLLATTLLPYVFFIVPANAIAQAGEWTWMHGSANATAVYGTQGVPSPLNHPPSLYEACEFTDKQGNLWIFGGDGNMYADLWKFDPVTYEWTWMGGPATTYACGNYGIKGVPSSTNWPGSHGYGAYTFVDTTGNFWLFGGWGIDANCSTGPLNDLWYLDLSTLTWTWISGDNLTNQGGIYGTFQVFDPLNKPGARLEGGTAWTDNNNYLWVFGGETGAGVHQNDMWKYDISSNQWAWMNGANTSNAPNNYGILGVSSPTNTPGARQAYCHWKDHTGMLWLFGGTNYTYYASDLWKFDVNNNEWTWVSGSNTSGSSGNTGALCDFDSSYFPPNRYENRAAWVDLNGDFYVYGGRDENSANLSDLWKYCVSGNEWALVNGTTSPNVAAVYGSYQVSSPLNTPGGRFGSVSWTDLSGNLWLFGGFNSLGDLWKFEPDPACGTCSTLPLALFTAPNHICPGTCIDFNNLSNYATGYQWSFPGATPSTSTDPNPLNICYANPGSYSVTLIANNANGSDTLTLSNYITVYQYPPPQGISQSGDTLFANQGSVSYQWYFGGNAIPGATNYYYVADTSGNYNVVCADNNGCEVEAAIFDVIAEVINYNRKELKFIVYPNPVTSTLTVFIQGFNGSVEISLKDMLGNSVFSIPAETAKKERIMIDFSTVSQGIYWLEFLCEGTIFRSRILKQ